MESEKARFGRVDFDDDESATVVTAFVQTAEPTSSPRLYELVVEPCQDVADPTGSMADHEARLFDASVGTFRDSLSIRVDELTAFFVHALDAEGLQEICDLARRGRDDFLSQASYGDYSAEDQDAASLRWEAASYQIDRIEHYLQKFLPDNTAKGDSPS